MSISRLGVLTRNNNMLRVVGLDETSCVRSRIVYTADVWFLMC